MLRKVVYEPENYSYYNCLPIQPGVFIYKALVESRFPLKYLKANIPETLCAFNSIYWITMSNHIHDLNLQTRTES